MHIDTGNYIINKTNTDNIRWWNIVRESWASNHLHEPS